MMKLMEVVTEKAIGQEEVRCGKRMVSAWSQQTCGDRWEIW